MFDRAFTSELVPAGFLNDAGNRKRHYGMIALLVRQRNNLHRERFTDDPVSFQIPGGFYVPPIDPVNLVRLYGIEMGTHKSR